MGRKGSSTLIIILILAIGAVLFLSVPLGGSVGLFREATISFIFREPPRFISMVVNVDGFPRTVNAGESLKVTGTEVIVISKIKANTFFDSYLTADVVGFGKPNDLHEPLDTVQVRKQLMDAGIRSVPIEVFYIEHTIAKVPLEIDLNRDDFMERIKAERDDDGRIAVLKSAHASFPGDPGFVDMLDKLLSKRNDYNTLAGIYRGVLERDPDDTGAYARLSRCYAKIGMYQEAMAAEQKIVEKGRADAGTYRRMASIAGDSGDVQARVGYLERALSLDPGSHAIIVELGRSYELSGRPDKALEIYRTAAGGAKDREILIPVIEDALKRKDYKEASALLKRYVAYYPKDKNAYAQLAMAMGRLGRTGDQTSYYARAVELTPNDPVLLFNLAASYEKAGKDRSALDTYRKVLSVKPGDTDSLARAAALALKQGEYRASYDYYRSLLKVRNSAENRKGLISAAVGLKDHDKIIDASREYLKAAGDYDVAITLAYAYEARAASKKGRMRLEDLNGALDAYRLALKLNPKSVKAQEKIPELKIETIKLQKGA